MKVRPTEHGSTYGDAALSSRGRGCARSAEVSHQVDDRWFEARVRFRKSLSKNWSRPEEIAVTTGASAGAAVVAYGLEWKRGDEIITVQREFPLQYATWKPMEEGREAQSHCVARPVYHCG